MDTVNYKKITCTKQWSFVSFASTKIMRLLKKKTERKKQYRKSWKRFYETVSPGTLNSIQENCKCCE